ncbi:MAG: hypothetical protein U0031_07930 [Thermomicrobiales bacterium]
MQRIGALDAMRTMMSVLREVSLEDLRQQADTTPRLLVVGPTQDEARRLGLALTGPEGQFASIYRGADESVEGVERIDMAVVWDPARSGAGSRIAEALRFESPPVPIIRFEGRGPEQVDAVEKLRAEMLKRSPERAPAFGRALPAFRAAAARQVIDETAAANAQFSLVSNIPALIPVIGNIAAAGADFIVLTKNQVMMLYKLAAIYGRDMRDQRRILQEVLPVVGAGLVWRTVAREAAALMPFAAGTVPKIVIAYVGTVAVGRAAEFYYRTGLRPSRAQMEQYYRQALAKLRQLDFPGVRRFAGRDDQGPPEWRAPQVTVVREDDPRREIDRSARG